MQLEAGEVVALLGASGSGKTTLLRAVAGLEEPKRGRIAIERPGLFDGGEGIEMPAEKRNLGLVFQSYALWPHRTVFDNVAYGLKLRKVPAAEIDAARRAALDQARPRPSRRALPAPALGRPAAARRDRARAGLQPAGDADGRAAVQPRRQAARGSARVAARADRAAAGCRRWCVTHDQTEAMAMSDRILLLNNGVIEQQGTPQEMYGRRDTLFTAEFMGSNNRIAGQGRRAARRRGAARGRRLAALGQARGARRRSGRRRRRA